MFYTKVTKKFSEWKQAHVGMEPPIIYSKKKTAKQYGMTPEQMLRGKNRGKWKGWQPLGVELRTPLAWAAMQCSATELQQPDNQQTPQSSICSYYIHFPLFSPHNIYFQHEQDALDTTTLSHHPYILCHFSSFACSLSVGSYNFLH